MNETLNTEARTTAGESPFSNGILVKHSKVLFDAFSKTLDDVMREPEIALARPVLLKRLWLGFDHNVNTALAKLQISDDLTIRKTSLMIDLKSNGFNTESSGITRITLTQ